MVSVPRLGNELQQKQTSGYAALVVERHNRQRDEVRKNIIAAPIPQPLGFGPPSPARPGEQPFSVRERWFSKNAFWRSVVLPPTPSAERRSRTYVRKYVGVRFTCPTPTPTGPGTGRSPTGAGISDRSGDRGAGPGDDLVRARGPGPRARPPLPHPRARPGRRNKKR